jgi:hypothetical protein
MDEQLTALRASVARLRAVHVRTSEPTRHFTLTLEPKAVTFVPQGATVEPDLEIPAEAFIRLVYGRLDPAHTPPIRGDHGSLDELRLVFPGV